MTTDAVSQGRLCAAVVSFRDWFVQTPSRFTSGRAPERRMSLVDYPRFVADELGLAQAELWSLFFDDLSLAYARKLGEAAVRAGVAIPNLLVDRVDADFGAADEVVRGRSVLAAKSWIDRAAMAGAASIRVNPALSANASPDPARIADTYLTLAEYGARLGVRVLVENHRPYFDAIGPLLDLAGRVEHPSFALLADCGNIVAATDAERIAALSSMLPKAALVSVKATGLTDERGEAAYDIGATVRAAEAAGYTGPYSIELFSYFLEMPADPVTEVRRLAVEIAANLIRDDTDRQRQEGE